MASNSLRMRGFSHVQIVDPDGTIVGDSGWLENQVVNLGVNDYLCQLLSDMAGSKQITHAALGTAGAPAAGGTALTGELEETSSREGITASTSNTSMKARFLATFQSASSFVSTTMSLSNIGLFNLSNVTSGSLFCGNSYATSTCATNQNVNITYDIDFSTS